MNTEVELIERHCEYCGEPYKERAKRRGRKRRWHARACRDKAYRSRKAIEESTEPPSA